MLLKQAIKFADQQTVAKRSCNIINLQHVPEMLLFVLPGLDIHCATV